MSDYSTFAHAIAGFTIEEMGFREIKCECDRISELRQGSWSDARSNCVWTNARVNENFVAECFDEIETRGRSQGRSEEHTSELQSRGLISYAVFCLKKK